MNTRALSPGTVVHNQYRVERVLGEGGFGVTYKVYDMRENRVAALKEYMPAEIAQRRPYSVEVQPKQKYEDSFVKFRDKFLEEARIIYRYRGHPNIIGVYKLFYENNTAYYAMEYIDGMDLAKMLEKNGGRLQWAQLYPIVAQMISALREVHRGNMIHCDISPDNIFILEGGQVKLIDFGAAKSTLNGQSSLILLKRGFAPPEQLSSQGNMGPWTDVYAMAVTVYRAFTGRMPPSSEDRLTQDRIIWPSQMGITPPSPQWEQALMKAMALRVEDRYQDVDRFWQDLSGQRLTQYQQAQYSQYQQAQYSQQQYGQYQQYSQQQYSQYQPQPWGYGGQSGRLVLEGVQGALAGQRFDLSQTLTLGIDPNSCNVIFPQYTPGISRMHLKVWQENGQVFAYDARSTYGTWLGDQLMAKGLVYSVPIGTFLQLGDRSHVFRVTYG